MEVLKAIKNRRSVRNFKTSQVDDKTVELILEAARWAPSWANSQCWRFIVVRDSDTKSKLADTVIAVSDRPNRGANTIRNAPVVIIACAELGKSGYYREPRGPVTDKGDWFMFDVASAMQNLALAAHSLGLGTVHIGAFDAEKAGTLLGIPEGFCVVVITPLGYPESEPSITSRKELSDIVSNEQFGLE